MNRLKVALILAFFLIAVLPLGAMVYISNAVYTSIIHKEVGNSLSAIADHKLTRWQDFEQQQRQRIRIISRSAVLKRSIADLRQETDRKDSVEPMPSTSSRIVGNIVREIKSADGFHGFYLIDVNGVILYQDQHRDAVGQSLYEGRYHGGGLQHLFDRALNSFEPVMSPFVEDVDEPGRFSFYIAAPIMSGPNVAAIIVKQFDNRELINIARDYTGIGESGEIVFAKLHEGSALLMAPLRHVEGASYKKRIELNGQWAKPVREALAGRSGVEPSFDYRQRPVLAAWHPIESAGIGMVVKIDAEEAYSQLHAHRRDILLLLAVAIVFVGLAGFFLSQAIIQPINRMVIAARKITLGDLAQTVPNSRWYELAQLGRALNAMLAHLRETISSVEADLWYKDSMTKLSEVLSADQSSQLLAKHVIRVLAEQLNAQAGTLYGCMADHLELLSHYGMGEAPELAPTLSAQQGLIGQALQDKKVIAINADGEDSVRIMIRSGSQKTAANSLMIIPLLYHGQIIAVVELAWLGGAHTRATELMEYSSESICLALIAAEQRLQVQNMLEQSQADAEELRRQQEELRVAKEETERQARELEAASQYKSEFLANMSHELRTPLNSLLILARSLVDNEEGHLADDEVESATVIYESGKHLLGLINDILDISKVESGKMQLNIETISIEDMLLSIQSRFEHMAKEKGCDFILAADPDVPSHVQTDGAKLNQILINLIGNAIKFTDSGSVALGLRCSDKKNGQAHLHFSVEDTGIGIPEDKLQNIFQAFQQVDGSISRVYGGTGLGLSIARKLAQVLDGDISVSSVMNQGSCFTLDIPMNEPPASENNMITQEHDSQKDNMNHIKDGHKDDRYVLDPSKPLLLIVEDDDSFSTMLLDVCHQQHCQAIIAEDGEAGIALAEQFPVQGVILDYMLPGIDGCDVLAALKSNAATQDLPVHVFTAMDGLSDLQIMGAVGKSLKPLSVSSIKNVIDRLVNPQRNALTMLVVEDDHATFLALTRLLKMEGVCLRQARSGREAVNLLRSESFDGVILDLGLPDTNGFDLLLQLEGDESTVLPPVIVYTAQDLSIEEQDKLGRFTQQIVIKSDDSAQRMLDEVQTFASLVCRSNEIEQEQKRSQAEACPESPVSSFDSMPSDNEGSNGASGLEGRVVLLVDDDMRNTFALAKVLRKKGVVVHLAPGGEEALRLLEEEDDIELVLMDIMMPQMDGYEATRRIRVSKELEDLPIIALTANAMKGDREKCLQAGANDYLSKPVDIDRLQDRMKRCLSC
ncbi:response regulator [Pseudoteredinibacter isoporae]|uniref:histidine kinase n=1 Tax=Pseudoteredinibacter isoporae TaxID=570281 RepID=A0A7X0JWQ0_9GAMM|nr:response regulator [Pseudoteredinibacter isoporae]MBB6522681.1 signal transduction histidine kinase/CheY-like chemotaxis protein [Pseudoteredinibacter isoporae]NHO88211.1 response regulator [Pseudoteredinibacter isoporae]NIB23458.1 response regulator [Pseudoteredinibacter isoporae]